MGALKKICFNIIIILRLYKIRELFLPYKGIVLMFHRVIEDKLDISGRLSQNLNLEISEEKLNELIKHFLSVGFDIVTLDEAYRRLNTKKRCKKFVVFTFDDGYKDNLDLALSIFKKHNVPYTIYLTTDMPDGNILMWWYALEEIIQNTNRLSFMYNDVEYLFNCNTLSEKNYAFCKAKDLILKTKSQTDLISLIETIAEKKVDFKKYTKDLALNWSDVIQLSKEPLVTIAAHTVTHKSLASLSYSEAKKEIEESKCLIENKIGKKVMHFAYPFGTKGEADEREYEIVKESDFRTAVTTLQGVVNYKSDLSSLSRIPVSYNTDVARIKILLSGIIEFKNIMLKIFYK